MIVDEFVLGARELEQLGEDGIDNHVLWLVLEFVSNDIFELVKRCSALSERGRVKVAVKVYEELGDDLAIEIELVDSVNKRISDE
jgi:hypothetical protein